MSSVTPVSAAAVTTWSEEADVVVVGFGAAGASAAYEAAFAGASVVILERAGAAGGSSALSDGLIYLGGGTSTQVGAGVTDTPDDMRRFLKAACGPAPDETKIDVYCERSIEHHNWLLARGVLFLARVLPEGGGPSPLDGEGLMHTGGENAHPFDELAAPAPRAHATQGARPGGSALMQVLAQAALDAGAKAIYDIRAERLVLDHGRVCGVVVRQYGEERAIRARDGVVLTAGGFAFDDDMVTQHAPLLQRSKLRIGTEGDDGRGIRMAQAVGARTKRMDSVECALPFNGARAHVHGVLVNALGRRFVNEDTYMGRIGQRALREDAVYLIVDEEHYTPGAMGTPASWVAESAEELETEIGLPAGSLVATLDYYNAHAAEGADPLLHKRSQWLSPMTPPLAAFDLRADRFPYAVFTLGGLDTTVDGEVLDIDGTHIPGLYAAGRTTSGIAAQGYCSGLSLGDSTLFGRLAGQATVRSN